ncbi:MAG: hypothetical protein IPK83_17675 [Planctomycetes bacterium]|nr:hypothetical protein [Planctomycetota bacterium]
MQLHVVNEYDTLEAVLVHRPGDEIDRLTHENMKRFLFEDIPYLTGMQEEHDEFDGDMLDRDIRVLYLEKLLLEVLATRQPSCGLLSRCARPIRRRRSCRT